MEVLATELQLHICSYLDIQSLKCLKLVSKRWSQVPDEFLFEHIFITLSPKHIERLTGILSHPVLPKYVKTVDYLTDLIRASPSQKDGATLAQRTRAWQDTMIALGRDEDLLGAQFQKLFNVKTFRALGACEMFREYRDPNRFDQAQEIPIVHYMARLLGAKPWEIYSRDTFERSQSVYALPLTFSKLENLQLGRVLLGDDDGDDIEWEHIVDYDWRYKQSWSVRGQLKPVFVKVLSKLKNLTLIHQRHSPHGHRIVVGLVSLLNHCGNLRSFTLDGQLGTMDEPTDEDDVFHADITEILKDATMPNLTDLSLTSYDGNAASLLAFLSRHKSLQQIFFNRLEFTIEEFHDGAITQSRTMDCTGMRPTRSAGPWNLRDCGLKWLRNSLALVTSRG